MSDVNSANRLSTPETRAGIMVDLYIHCIKIILNTDYYLDTVLDTGVLVIWITQIINGNIGAVKFCKMCVVFVWTIVGFNFTIHSEIIGRNNIKKWLVFPDRIQFRNKSPREIFFQKYLFLWIISLVFNVIIIGWKVKQTKL